MDLGFERPDQDMQLDLRVAREEYLKLAKKYHPDIEV